MKVILRKILVDEWPWNSGHFVPYVDHEYEELNLSIPQHAKEVLTEFGEDTFTMEFPERESHPGVKWLVDNKLISRHPGGPFGSRCSYYRTEAGIAEWLAMKLEDMNNE